MLPPTSTIKPVESAIHKPARNLLFKKIVAPLLILTMSITAVWAKSPSDSGVEPYPLINSNISKYSDIETDEAGIPLLTFKSKKIYYPIQITQIALHYYAHYLESGDEASKAYFLDLAKWLLANFKESEHYGGWYTDDPLLGSDYTLPDHWLSAMSQGFGLSVMVGAHSLTGADEFLEVSDKILASFESDVSMGGVASSWGATTWYDEYPSSPEKHVLNGFIFGLAGLQYYYCYSGDLKAKALFEQGTASLKEHLATFDAGFNSYYSQSTNRATEHGFASSTGAKYHDLHVVQLLWLYAATQDTFFRQWAHIFLTQDFGDIYKYGIDHKFEHVVASHTVEPKKFGINNISDSNWTYGAYWSTNLFPTELEITFSRPVDNLTEVILVTTGNEIKESDMTLYAMNISKWTPIEMSLLDKYKHTTRHHEALVHRFRLSNAYNQVEKVKFKFTTTKAPILALREVNFRYDMELEVDQLIETLDFDQSCRAGD